MMRLGNVAQNHRLTARLSAAIGALYGLAVAGGLGPGGMELCLVPKRTGEARDMGLQGI
jgi:hypothetical protein